MAQKEKMKLTIRLDPKYYNEWGWERIIDWSDHLFSKNAPIFADETKNSLVLRDSVVSAALELQPIRGNIGLAISANQKGSVHEGIPFTPREKISSIPESAVVLWRPQNPLETV